MKKKFKIFIPIPNGFCAGVIRAIDIVEKLISIYGTPIYVFNEIVHNIYVINNLKKKGIIFTNSIFQIPKNSIIVFSAHGVPSNIRTQANNRKLNIFDATCPLVTKVHIEVKKMISKQLEIIVIGHKNHPEIKGIFGENNNCMHLIENINDIYNLKIKNSDKLSYVTQTTLSFEETNLIIKRLKEIFPKIIGPNKKDICYATQNRQNSIKMISRKCDLIFIIGSKNSSNSNSLCVVIKKFGISSYLIENIHEINLNHLMNSKNIGISAGASAPAILVDEFIEQLKFLGAKSIQKITEIEEKISFSLPKYFLKNKNLKNS